MNLLLHWKSHQLPACSWRVAFYFCGSITCPSLRSVTVCSLTVLSSSSQSDQISSVSGRHFLLTDPPIKVMRPRRSSARCDPALGATRCDPAASGEVQLDWPLSSLRYLSWHPVRVAPHSPVWRTRLHLAGGPRVLRSIRKQRTTGNKVINTLLPTMQHWS